MFELSSRCRCPRPGCRMLKLVWTGMLMVLQWTCPVEEQCRQILVCTSDRSCLNRLCVRQGPPSRIIPSNALKAGSTFPPDATSTASTTPSSTFGKASTNVAFACERGLTGRGGLGGGVSCTGEAVVSAADAGAAAVGVGSRLLSSSDVELGLSVITSRPRFYGAADGVVAL